jgi:hypothetical protein
LLLCGYCQGERSSRVIERRCVRDVAYRVICGGLVPDHATIARFRARHERALGGLFSQVLRLLAAEGERMAARLRRARPAQAAPPPRGRLTVKGPSPGSPRPRSPDTTASPPVSAFQIPSARQHGFVRQAGLCSGAPRGERPDLPRSALGRCSSVGGRPSHISQRRTNQASRHASCLGPLDVRHIGSA